MAGDEVGNDFGVRVAFKDQPWVAETTMVSPFFGFAICVIPA